MNSQKLAKQLCFCVGTLLREDRLEIVSAERIRQRNWRDKGVKLVYHFVETH